MKVRDTFQTLCRDCLAGFPATETAGRSRCPGCGSARLVRHEDLSGLAIAHIDCDAFYAAIEKRDRPELRDRPVAVGGASGRGVLTTACYVARRWGLGSAMPAFQARRLCPEAVFLPPDFPKYRAVAEQIRAQFRALTPAIEPLSLDEAYLDLSDSVRRVAEPPARALARMALSIEAEIGITVSVGLAANKFLAKLASDLDKPRGFAAMGTADAPRRLAPLPVRAIRGVGPRTAEKLGAMGIETVGQLQALPAETLIRRFGKAGAALAGYRFGRDDRPVQPERETKSLSAETTFATDSGDRACLEAALAPLAERVARRLDRHGLAGRTVVVKLKSSDFRERIRHSRLAHPTCRADVMCRAAAPILAQATGAEATGTRAGGGRPTYRLIGIGVTDLDRAENADPPDLFDRLDRAASA